MVFLIHSLFSHYPRNLSTVPSSFHPSDVLYAVLGMELEGDHSLILRNKHLVLATRAWGDAFEAFWDIGHVVWVVFIDSHRTWAYFGYLAEVWNMAH